MKKTLYTCHWNNNISLLELKLIIIIIYIYLNLNEIFATIYNAPAQVLLSSMYYVIHIPKLNTGMHYIVTNHLQKAFLLYLNFAMILCSKAK